MVEARVVGLNKSGAHSFSKYPCSEIKLIAGKGVEGDAHKGVQVKHRSRVKRDPSQPNLRQVHLLHAELFTQLAKNGFAVKSGDIGENITTSGVDLLTLPRGTQLKIGTEALIEISGLRNPCQQLNNFQAGLMQAVLDTDQDGKLIRKAGIMGIVLKDGVIRLGDSIKITLPAEPHVKLAPV